MAFSTESMEGMAGNHISELWRSGIEFGWAYRVIRESGVDDPLTEGREEMLKLLSPTSRLYVKAFLDDNPVPKFQDSPFRAPGEDSNVRKP